MNTMLKRAAATQACMERFAYRTVAPGVRDCGKLSAHALHKQGRSAKLLNGTRGRTWDGAIRYVRSLGFETLIQLMDAQLGVTPEDRIPPAAALPGDIVALPVAEDDPFGCSLSVALDNGRVLALNPLSRLIEPMTPHLFVCAWRV